VCSGSQTGQSTLAPKAKLKDGLLDIVAVPDFGIAETAGLSLTAKS